MGSSGNGYFFPLTSLQIGDMQSYLSTLTLFVTPESNNLFILVDNRPWLVDQDKWTAYLWQQVVTKSRLSPFANSRPKRERNISGKKLDYTSSSKPDPIKLRRLHRWFTLIDAATYQKRVLLPVKKLKDSIFLSKELHHILYGFIVFEVSWNHVRGINYQNELQTDTSMALEAKVMKRWEFDSIEQALSCISIWYSGTSFEKLVLQNYLADVCNIGDAFYDAPDDIPLATNHSSDSPCSPASTTHPSTPPACGPYKKRKIAKLSTKVDDIMEAYGELVCSPRLALWPTNATHDNVEPNFEPTTYKDGLIIFKFDDHDLPFKLKDKIMSDLRLLTLLEYGLPSWVIFFQSYPVFSQIYRPWMCPLARSLYVIISVVTVVIGFYDLYKNVPMLKAAASGLLGPFFDWIESWEMISRLKYLGTMLFLHNCQKAIKWVLMATRAGRSFISILTKPIAAPLMELWELAIPIWSLCAETAESFGAMVWLLLESSYSMVVGLLQVIVWPFLFICSVISSAANLIICPILLIFWEIFVAPIRMISAAINFVVMISCYLYILIRDSWSSISALFQMTPTFQAASVASEPSIWKSLWNDLFSQVFRAIRTILYGFVAFFTTCNRHRLSIYNHIQEFYQRFSNAGNSKLTNAWKKKTKSSDETLISGSSKLTSKQNLRLKDRLHRRRSTLTK